MEAITNFRKNFSLGTERNHKNFQCWSIPSYVRKTSICKRSSTFLSRRNKLPKENFSFSRLIFLSGIRQIGVKRFSFSRTLKCSYRLVNCSFDNAAEISSLKVQQFWLRSDRLLLIFYRIEP